MTDEPSARDIATAIVRDHLDHAFSASFVTPADQDLIDAITDALLSRGRRERAMGMRDGADVCKELTMATLLLALGEMTAQERRTTRAVVAYCAICIEHRARETEGPK
jgi:hypothetical protein